MSDIVETLRKSPAVVMQTNPYFNVARMVYVDMDVLREAVDHIRALEAQVAAYERYLDGPALSASGVPVTKRP